MEPKIRLKGFSGGWRRTTFASSFDFLRNNSLSRAELSDSGSVRNIHYGDILIQYNECTQADQEIKTFVRDEELAKKLYLSCAIKHGDVIFADAAEDNTVGKCTEIITDGGESVVSGLHTIACRPKKEFASMYLGYYLNSCAYHDQLLPHIQGTKISSISKSALVQTYLSYPVKGKEQQAIASYFQHLDSLIQSVTKKIESLKQVKEASLQTLFPQEGETTPRVRFKGFEGEWDTTIIETICKKASSILSENSLGENMGDYPVYGASGYLQNIPTYGFDKPYVGIIKDGSGVGRSQLYPAYSSILGTMQYLLPKGNVKTSFLAYIFETIDFSMYVNGSSIPHIYFKDYCRQEIKIPQDKEQEMIGEFFTHLDSLISLHSQRLEKLRQVKSACLDNMFV